jgi:hypothetical protein
MMQFPQNDTNRAVIQRAGWRVGWLDRIEKWSRRRLERKARGFGKSVARIMLVAFHAVKEAYRSNKPTQTWLAREALKTRPSWRQLDETRFAFEKTGQAWAIPDGTPFSDVVFMVIEVELEGFLANRGHDLSERNQLVGLALDEANKYLRSKTNIVG